MIIDLSTTKGDSMKKDIMDKVSEIYDRASLIADSEQEELVLGRLVMLNNKIKSDENVFDNTLEVLLIGKMLEGKMDED